MRDLPNINPNQPIAIDLETCDPELRTLAPGYITKVGFVAGYAIAAEEGSFYIPVGHTEGENYDHDKVKEWLNYTLSGDTDKIFHNAQYDLGWLKYVGVQLKGTLFDTLLAAALIDENRKTYTLDSVGKTYANEGKNEVALEMAVKNKYSSVKTHKTIIRYKEDIDIDYAPFFEAKKRVCPFFELYPKSVQDKYEVCGTVTSSRGSGLYKVPTTTMNNIKGLLWSIDPEEMGSYPIQDVDLTYKLYKKFKPILSSEGLDKHLVPLENELLPCLLEMREQGVKIDMPKAIDLDKEYTASLDKLQKELDTLAGFEVNVDATTDLVAICEKYNLEYSKTSKGNPCFSAELIPNHRTFELVLEIRHLKKARDTYIRGYCFSSSINGRLHGQYNQLKSDDGGTVTGRLSSSGPNLQNIPAREKIGEQMRSLFIPDTPDEKWLCMDFSGQEPKMLVNLVLMLDKALGTRQVTDKVTGEVRFIQEEGFPGAKLARQPIFSGRQADFHTAVARECMKADYRKEGLRDVSEEKLATDAKAFRKKAKSIGLGIMYGSGSKKIAEGMTMKGMPMTEKEAADLKDSICHNIPFFGAVNKYVMNLAQRRGYVLTLLKRRGRFDLWEYPVWNCPAKLAEQMIANKPLFKSRAEGLEWFKNSGTEFASKYQCQLGNLQRAFTYKALNKIIQGSSADQTKAAMLRLYKRNKLHVKSLDIYFRRADFVPPKSRIQVHDEMNFSIKPDEDINWYQDIMEHSLPLLVESVAEPGVGNNWNEAK